MRTCWLLVATLACTSAQAWAQDNPAEDGKVQALIIARVLSFDRALAQRSETSVNVGLLVRSGDASSATRTTVQGFLSLKDRTIQGRTIVVAARAYRGTEDLEEWIAKERIAVIYLLPALAEQAGEIGEVLRRKSVVSVGPDRKTVADGFAFGIVPDGGKHKLLLNQEAARAVHMDLDPKVLELAEAVKLK
jgi:hypothetical protein